MGIPLLIFGIILFASAYNGEVEYFAGNLETDVTGFFKWAAAILAIGAIGIIPKARPISKALLVLVFVVLLLNNKSFFSNLGKVTSSIPAPPPRKGLLAAISPSPGTAPGLTPQGSSGNLVAGGALSSAASSISSAAAGNLGKNLIPGFDPSTILGSLGGIF